MAKYDFSAEVYRVTNIDLRNLSDAELFTHYVSNRAERRLYARTETTTELLSMRWLRGDGLEVGAGRHPTPLYGNARIRLSDIDNTGIFYGGSTEISGSLDHPDYYHEHEDAYDFVIASHVLEHVYSFLLAIQNMTKICKKRYYLYSCS